MGLTLFPILAHPTANRTTKDIAIERKFKITVDGRQYNVTVEELNHAYSESVILPPPAPLVHSLAPEALLHVPAHAAAPAERGDVVSTLGGVVESVLVTEGQQVGEGDRILILEAMKMKTPITTSWAGKVAAILVKVGDGVETGQVLVKVA